MPESELSPVLLQQLEHALLIRDVRTGFALLDTYFSREPVLTPEEPGAAELLLVLAQWTDLGYRDLQFLESHLAIFSRASRTSLGTMQYLQLKLAESYVLLARRRQSEAAKLLDALLHLGGDILPPYLLFVSYFWKGRAHRQESNFDQALSDVQTARAHAASLKADKLIAVTKIHESWLAFHRGERRLAFELLDQAEATLASTRHALSLGNIAAARGRFVRSSGDYARSLAYFEQAIEIYRQHNPEHPNVARALVNAAYVKRLLALEMHAARRQGGGASHAKALKMADEAMDLLRDAARIYALHQHQGGSGSVLVNLGHLQLESGDIDAAQTQAQLAYLLGKEKEDTVLRVRARILQAYVEMACSEEQMDERLDPVSHAQRAIQFADEAVQMADQVQNGRLLAGAYITRGLAATDESVADWDTARSYALRAGDMLNSEDRDHLFRELTGLRHKILNSRNLDETLRGWANGDVGTKSFQELEEEFAEIVIPKVWANLGKNVSRVAGQLSISPKKVRRILRKTRAME